MPCNIRAFELTVQFVRDAIQLCCVCAFFEYKYSELPTVSRPTSFVMLMLNGIYDIMMKKKNGIRGEENGELKTMIFFSLLNRSELQIIQHFQFRFVSYVVMLW